jgi:broad specificity phosphatase PhoE
MIMTVVHWARHGENVANTSRMFSYRIFDGDLTDRGTAQARQLAEVLRAAAHRYGLLAVPLGTGQTGSERRTFGVPGG